jgi:hypothetical protein
MEFALRGVKLVLGLYDRTTGGLPTAFQGLECSGRDHGLVMSQIARNSHDVDQTVSCSRSARFISLPFALRGSGVCESVKLSGTL